MPKIKDDIRKRLVESWGARVSFDELERKIYARDMGVMPSLVQPLVGNPVPDAIVQPESEQELINLVNLARQEKIKLTPRAKATSGYGGVLPVEGGLVVEFNRMKRIIDIDADERSATVEPGVVWNELEYHLNQKGLTLALYPTSAPSSTVGGWLAQGGAGIGSYEYGYFKDNVFSARLVQLDGTVVELHGKDLNLVSDANGTTGFISQVRLRIKPLKPMHVNAIAFDRAEQMASFITGLYNRKVPIWSVTFINPEAARMRNSYPPHLHHGHPVMETHKVILPEKFIVLLACTTDRCDLIIDDVTILASKDRGVILSPEIAEHEWAARFEPMRAKRIAPSLIPSEVVVPVDKLAEVINETSQEIDHPFILEGFTTNRREVVLLGFIPHDERKLNFNLAYGLSLTALKVAQKHGGRPYATGLYFSGFAREILGHEHLDTLVTYKKIMDPEGLMNPGKVMDGTLVAGGLKIASAMEPLIRIFGNLAKG
ncbi:MAG: FAD-binding oxidoreductase, partial [Syntrophomonadaceae bacterium]